MATKKKPNASSLVEVPGWKGKFFLGPNHTYWWKDKKDSEPRALSGITSVLGVINKPALVQWSANMTVEYIKSYTSSFMDLAMADIDWDDLLDTARFAHNRKKDDAASKGTDAHALIEEYIKNCIVKNGGIPWDQFNSIEPRVIEFAGMAASQGWRFIASETPLADPKNAIAGTPDFIAEHDGRTIIGDLKTGSGVYDRTFFAQMSAYGYMWMKKNKTNEHPMLCVVHAPSSKPEQPISLYWSDDFKGDWEGFKSALYLHRWKDNFARK